MSGYFAILPILSAILCMSLGLFVFSRNPRHPANISFVLGMATLAAAEIGGFTGPLLMGIMVDATSTFLMGALLIAGGGLLLCFLMFLFRESKLGG